MGRESPKMKISLWLADTVWDRSKLKRAMREYELEREKSRLLKKEHLPTGVTTIAWQNLVAERIYEESLAQSWVDSILTSKVLHEAERRYLPIPLRLESSPHWYKSFEEEWVLTNHGRERLQRTIRLDRRAERQLKLQIAMAVTGVFGSVAGVLAVILALSKA